MEEITPARVETNAARRAIQALRDAARTRTFWALAGGFAICGATTNGLVGTHFVPSAHDHGMAETTAAGLLAVVGVFDIVGTLVSGALTDRIDPRILLVAYYFFRGLGLLVLPWLLAPTVHASMVLFIVIYGLDWVATVPPLRRCVAERSVARGRSSSVGCSRHTRSVLRSPPPSLGSSETPPGSTRWHGSV